AYVTSTSVTFSRSPCREGKPCVNVDAFAAPSDSKPVVTTTRSRGDANRQHPSDATTAVQVRSEIISTSSDRAEFMDTYTGDEGPVHAFRIDHCAIRTTEGRSRSRRSKTSDLSVSPAPCFESTC